MGRAVSLQLYILSYFSSIVGLDILPPQQPGGGAGAGLRKDKAKIWKKEQVSYNIRVRESGKIKGTVS